MITTVGQILINDALPKELRDYDRVLDKKGLKNLLGKILQSNPDEYKDIIHKLEGLGADFALSTGSSFSIKDFRPSETKKRIVAQLDKRIKQIANHPTMSDDKKNETIIRVLAERMDEMRDGTHQEGLDDGNSFSRTIKSGARGNPANLSSLRGADLMVLDHKDRPIPIPILNNFSEGLSPAEYFAGAYGTRKGIVATKMCLSGDTLVLMADCSSKPISDIVPGEEVMGADLDGNTFVSRVVRKYDNGVRSCREFKFRSGRSNTSFLSLIATDQHEILARKSNVTRTKGWFTRREKMPLSLARCYSNPHKNTFSAVLASGCEYDGLREDRALLLGLMLGDGCSRNGKHSFSCADQSLVDDIDEYLKKFNLRLGRGNSANYTRSLADIRSYRKVFGKKGNYNPCKQWLSRTIGESLAHEKSLPEDVWCWDIESVSDVISGLFSTDGSVCVVESGNRKIVTVSYTSASRILIEQVYRLLRFRLGVMCQISFTAKETKQFAKNDQWTIRISNAAAILNFHRRVNLVGKKRRKMVESIRHVRNPKDIPYTGRIFCKTEEFECETFDIEVDNTDHLFVLANGMIVSNSTAQAGFLGKQLANASGRLVVTDEEPLEGTGFPVDADDEDNEGAVLASDYGPYRRGTVLTPSILRHIKRAGNDEILVHSPISAGGSGIPQWAAGVRERGGLSPIGDNIGIAAAQAASEPISQSQLSAKHAAGVVGAAKETSIGGFQAINQLVQIPKSFQNAAALSRLDGRVSLIEDAPQGGKYVHVGDEKHYVFPGMDLEVKVGDTVESGDALSVGVPNPAEVVKYKHVGEGRRYLVNRLRKTLLDNGIGINRRNLELVSRGIINHVRVLEPDGVENALPDDIIPYDEMTRRYRPRFGNKTLAPGLSRGKYLEKPVLHYSIGTRVTPSVIKMMKRHKTGPLVVHDDPPPFEPHMVRALETTVHDPDWFRRLSGFYIGKGFMDAARRGGKSEIHGQNWAHSLSEGVNFGRQLDTKGVY